jgi:Zn-dependent peptidase ImmA (M78 family)
MRLHEITVKSACLHLVGKREVRKRILFYLFHGLGHQRLLKKNMTHFFFDITWVSEEHVLLLCCYNLGF